MSSPSVGIAATAAAMTQMLRPPVMYVVEQAVPAIREYVDTHAFGARRTKVVDPG